MSTIFTTSSLRRQRECTKTPTLENYTAETDATSRTASEVSDSCSYQGAHGILKYNSQAASLDRSYQASSDHAVSWSTVEIHSHAIQLGDNPAVSHGPPVTITWKAFDSQTVSLEDYETHKPDQQRTKQQMAMPRTCREDILRKEGCSRGEMKKAIEEVSTIRKSRARNSKQAPLKRLLKAIVSK
jgi:hypothetical protein